MNKKLLVMALFFCSALFSCTSGSDDDDDDGGGGGDSSGQLSGACELRTVGGPTCPDGIGPVAFVTGVVDGEITGVCSGVFISPSRVLTAAHCSGLPGTLTVFISDREIEVTGISIHPRYNTSSAQTGQFDVMVLNVERQSDVTPLPLFLSESIGEGDPITVYGYGPDPSSDDVIDETPPLGRADLTITQIDTDELLFAAVRQSGGSGGCAGDSGGPVVQENRDGLFGVVGLVEGGSNNTCQPGTINIYTGVQAESIASFILQAVPEAGVI